MYNLISKDGLVEDPLLRETLSKWKFTVGEISPSVYRVQGVDTYGRSVSRVGGVTELEELIKKCLYDAAEIVAQKHS